MLGKATKKKGVPVSTPFSPLFTSFTSTLHIALCYLLNRLMVLDVSNL